MPEVVCGDDERLRNRVDFLVLLQYAPHDRGIDDAQVLDLERPAADKGGGGLGSGAVELD
ncbi:MAG: hypothetical protein EOM22_03900 [Gammaproteobacteria bacterium]|nr:hypothetical protein [Gammaproteobacteria bacterium]